MSGTTSTPKFLPEGIPSWQQPFWDSLRAHDVRVQRCGRCGKYRHHPKDLCPRCHARVVEWAPIVGRGSVYTYTVVRRAPTPAYEDEIPYAIVHAIMDEGFRMIATIRNIQISAVSIGLPVRVAYDDVTPEWTLLVFEPDDAKASAKTTCAVAGDGREDMNGS